jgi:hypothetical protein
MLVAKDKVKNNVGEYIIYMYQIEDLIRACSFEKKKIEASLISQYKVNEADKAEIRNWYYGLCDLMEEEQVQEKGHLSLITNKANELNEFHLYLLSNPDHKDYQAEFTTAAPIIEALSAKNKTTNNAIQLVIDAIYGYYLLKLKKQEITEGTQQSIVSLSKLLGILSEKFKLYEKGEIVIE